ncbi:uncharacterized protein LOC129581223 [Paramacrobiotus metropolitanus]|uniref:uncharacterized protein LOC129581223 n=1 Tax=Paramacrobiotus metropolitanus TaxID=2943436 RepID=UPI0024459E54|nr:uncharacterized protein LOC129581223 [Paramacrobiotus metropolitanus]
MVIFVVCIFLLFTTFAASQPLTQKQRCNFLEEGGKICAPDACRNATCSLLPEAICLSDQCGCRAQFFLYTSEKSEKPYESVTLLCNAATEIEAAKNTFKNVLNNNERAADTLARNSELQKDLFNGLKTFIVDIMQIITNHLKKEVEKSPITENLQRYEHALGRLRKMKKQGLTLDDYDKILL